MDTNKHSITGFGITDSLFVTANKFFGNTCPDYSEDTASFNKVVAKKAAWYTFPVKEVKNLNYELTRPSILGIKHSVESIRPYEIQKTNFDWVFGLFLFSMFLLAIVMANYRRRLRQIGNAMLSIRNMNLMAREGNLFFERISLFLFILFLSLLSLFVFIVLLFYYELDTGFNNGIFMYLKIVGIILFLYISRTVVVDISGRIFQNTGISYFYLLNIFATDLFSGIFLLPALFFAFYLESLIILKIAVGLFILLVLLRLIRGVVIGSAPSRFSKFYLFLYLCTLEILPLIVIAKLLIISFIDVI